jgi:hypothetical protein
MIRTFTRARRAARFLADAVRSVATPAALVREQDAATVPDPADAYTAEEMPAPEVIEAAATDFAAAGDQARAADRAKRKARKVLDRLPAGLYGRWQVERIESARQTPDLEAIRATYARLGLGEVPMRACAPSLRITAAPAALRPAEAAPETSAVLTAA